MRWLVQMSLRFRLMMVALAAGVLLLGITRLGSMPVDVLPEFNPPSVEVQTEALGLSAQEVEQLITVPLEQDLLNGVPWLAEIRSESLPGLSSVVMTFDPGTDPLRARQVVGERLTQAFALPHVSRPPTMLQPTSAANRVLMVGLSAPDLSLIDLSVLARWTIAPRLMGVPGVANVSIWGQRDRQLQVQVDPKDLQAKNVSLMQVLETTGNAMWVSSLSFVEASTPGTGGFIETPSQRLGIRHVFPISSAAGLAQVPVEGTLGLRLGDVAEVVEDHQPLIGDAVAGPSLLLVVEKSPSANTLAVTEGLDKAIAAMRPGLAGVEINPSIYRPAGFIETVIGNFWRALVVGAMLLLFVAGAFLFNWRAALISAIALLVSVTAGALILDFRGASVNMMVVVGFVVALGLLINDAIVDVDNVLRRLRQQRAGPGAASLASVVLESALEARGTALYTIVILGVVVAPVWLVGGLSGALLQPLVASYAVAILASMAVALLLTPALCLLLLARTPSVGRREPPLGAWLQRGYSRALNPLLRRPQWAFLALGVGAVVGIALLPLLHTSLLPAFKEPSLLIRLQGPPSTSQPEMDRIVGRMGEELRSVAGVRTVGAHVGRALLSDRRVNVNSSEIWVTLDPAAPYERTAAAVRRVVNSYPGLRHEFQTYLQDRTGGLAASEAPLTVRVFGENPAVLRRAAEDVQHGLTGIDGLAGQHLELPVQQPTLEVEVDLPAAQRYGLKPGDVRRAAATLLSGMQVGSLFEDQKIFDVVVWGTPETRSSISSIRDLVLDTPLGGHVRLGEVAQVRIVPALSVIRHQDVRGFLDIRLDVRGRSVPAVAADVEQRLQRLQLPLEYHAEVLGDYAQQQAAASRLPTAGLAAALGIFLILQAAIGSWGFAAFAWVMLPVALVGSIMAVVASGGVLNLGGLAGLVAVTGLATRNVLGLARHYQRLEREEGLAVGPELIQRGAREQLVPALATALCTGVALVPFLVWGDAPGLEVVRPLGVVVLGGLLSATLLHLFVMPLGYLLLAGQPTQATSLAAAPAPGVAVGQAAD